MAEREGKSRKEGLVQQGYSMSWLRAVVNGDRSRSGWYTRRPRAVQEAAGCFGTTNADY